MKKQLIKEELDTDLVVDYYPVRNRTQRETREMLKLKTRKPLDRKGSRG